MDRFFISKVKKSSPNVFRGFVTKQGRDFSYGTLVGMRTKNGEKENSFLFVPYTDKRVQ